VLWALEFLHDGARTGSSEQGQMKGSLSGKAVLIVEDHFDSAEVLTVLMEVAGATVHSAVSAEAALSLLDGSWKPDVLLLDIFLPPGMDGCDLLTVIRCDPRLGDVPAVAITAMVRAIDKLRMLDAGFTTLVPKPYDGPALVALVVQLVG
jgi:CheY-like chemotaxis protein